MTQFTRENEFVMEKVAGEEAASYVRPQLNADKRKKKKKSGAFGIFRAARFMMRKRTDEKEAKKAIEKEKSNSAVNVNRDWKMIVGSIRPLHVHEAPESPMHAMSPASDAFSEPSPAPSSASSSSSSSSCTMSQYASASNLRDLCNSDDEEDQDEVFDAVTGDEMIDSKAEEFIAQFYKQIYHQNSITPPRTAEHGIPLASRSNPAHTLKSRSRPAQIPLTRSNPLTPSSNPAHPLKSRSRPAQIPLTPSSNPAHVPLHLAREIPLGKSRSICQFPLGFLTFS